MIRIFAAIGVWILFLGGPLLYMQQRTAQEAASDYVQQEALGILSVTLTPSFEPQPDPFALQIDNAAAVRLTLNGQEILHQTKPSAPGNPIVIENASGLVEGKNEFYLEAYPPLDSAMHSHAIRLQVLRDGEPIADRTFWSAPGNPIAETFLVEIAHAEKTEEAGDSHGH